MLGYVYRWKLKILCVFIAFHVFRYFIQLVIFVNKENSMPILVWWTPFIPGSNRIIHCSNGHGPYKCLITEREKSPTQNTKVGAYLFYGSQIINHDFPLPKNNNILWAVFHEESPKNYAPFLFEETQRLFNITSTFSRYSDFPVTLQYLTDISLIKDTKYFVPVHIKNKYLNEISPVLYIQSDCDTPISRDNYVKELGEYISIDSYGKCLTNKAFPKELSDLDPLDLYHERLMNFISRYKFIIAFENSVCDDYITEKLWKPLIAGSIPIYLGSPTIEDWLPNNNSAILVKNYKNLREVGNVIKKINKDDVMYESFLEHKLKSKITNNLLKNNILKDHPVPAFECSVCAKLHKNDRRYKENRRNIYKCTKPKASEKENTWDQHWEIGSCQSKALQLLMSKNKPYSQELFEQTWKEFLHNKSC